MHSEVGPLFWLSSQWLGWLARLAPAQSGHRKRLSISSGDQRTWIRCTTPNGSTSNSFNRMFSVNRAALIGSGLLATVKPLDVAAFREFLSSIETQGASNIDHDVEIELPSLGRRALQTSNCNIRMSNFRVCRWRPTTYTQRSDARSNRIRGVGGQVMLISYPELARRARGAAVIVATGYSALGYQNRDEVAVRIRRLVEQLLNSEIDGRKREVLVTSGATIDGGICDIAYAAVAELKATLRYEDRRRLVTVGLVSATAKAKGIGMHDVDLMCVVEPSTRGSWQVKSPDGRSLTADLPLQSKHVGIFVTFGGGKVTAAELTEAMALGVTCLVFEGEAFRPRDDKLAEMKAKFEGQGKTGREQDQAIHESADAVEDVGLAPGLYVSGRLVCDDPDAAKLPNVKSARSSRSSWSWLPWSSAWATRSRL